MHSQHDLVLIRHARSTFNASTFNAIQQMSLDHLTWHQMVKIPQFNDKVTYNPQHFDARLSQVGRKQGHQLNMMFNNYDGPNKYHSFNIFDVDLILVSPYYRALQTCRLVFKDCKAPIIVEPLACEVFRYACDVPESLENKKQQYKNYDFSKLNELSDDDYYLYVFPEQEKNKIKEMFKQKNAVNLKDKQNIILNQLAKHNIYEHSNWMRERISRLKDTLLQYKKKYNKIAIVAHNYTLQFILCKQFKESGQLGMQTGILNCYPYYNNIEQICKIR